MPALTRRVALLATLWLLACGHAALARDPKVFEYHGWQVDASRVPNESREAVMGPVQQQIDAIERFGIAQDIVLFMRTVPLHVNPSQSEPAHYARATGIDFRLDTLDPKKPVLLHELLRAFQEQKLGTDNKTVQSAFQEARASGVWPADAGMLKSAQDFFAATATVYLFGTVDTPPFTQGRLHQAQAEYWKWLGETFDGFRGCD
jgi:hypothetical protein